ncbi:F-box/WD repeat-containing protein [Sparassis crispa]|uniref:F-box/WD repeat-containing protein n=1 Tax=Sparassis crispa TaxID=139825 RepID=A0A401H6Z6_9APHY|nr:F-box/WD repeat-containing protein [Sparassis crispa]GBE90159.1 F-box/WD repeat-containing protein [Sparassis crispa]
MIVVTDEGFTDAQDEAVHWRGGLDSAVVRETGTSIREREELAYSLLASLPRSSLAVVQRRIAPLLQLDVVGLLPDEVAIQVFSHLPYTSLLSCALVSRRWHTLTDDQTLWKRLCAQQNWEWRFPYKLDNHDDVCDYDDMDDEGMGDEEESEEAVAMLLDDSGFSSMLVDEIFTSPSFDRPMEKPRTSSCNRYPGSLSLNPVDRKKPDYKLLHQTHVHIRNRFLSGNYFLSYLQTRSTRDAHSNTIYCLQLYTYPDCGLQVLFTGSKDHTVREWNLSNGTVRRVIKGVHEGSVLSVCAHNGLLVSGGSDRRVVIWDLGRDVLRKVILDHEDSVLCVRFDDKRLVTCSKDRTVRTYTLPDFVPQHILGDHRAAVNAVSISSTHIVSASGDRSMRLWDAEKGTLLRTFENHHGRGIASIDYKPPFVLSGSSDKHLRLLDIASAQGWSTAPDAPGPTAAAPCQMCGSTVVRAADDVRRGHEDLVRSVALGEEFVVSGSYDFTVKVWDRKTGALVADLAGGHTGRIFCVGFDRAKIVSCGEDRKICIWDFAYGFDTSFIKL